MSFNHDMGSNMIQPISTNYIDKVRQNLQVKSTAQNSNTQTGQPTVDKLPSVTPDFNIKVPMTYQKIKDIEFPYDVKASWYKLGNGQNVIIVPKEGTTVVKSYVKTGSMNEPDHLRGISHYIEHNLFNGSDGLGAGEFFERVNDMGANTNAATGFAETNYFISSNLLNKDDLEQKIKLHASMLQSPHFATDMLLKEKGIVNSEINMILSDPDNIAFNRVIKNLYNIKSTSTDLIGGSTNNINNITREDVTNYFNQNYYPANITTVITGEVNPDETIKLVAKYFNSTKMPPAKRNYETMQPLQTATREDLISDKAHATGIYAGFNGPANNDAKGQILLKALSEILTGNKNARLTKATRDYNADIFMDFETVSTKPEDGIAIVFNGETTEENSAQVLKIIANKIDELKYIPPTQDEMNYIKKSLKSNFADNFEMSSSLNSLIGESFLDGIPNSINEYEKIVDSLTPEDISNAAKQYLDTSKAAIVLIHPATVNAETIKNNHVAAQNITFTGASSEKTNKKTAINMNNVKSYKLQNNFQVVTNDIKTNNCKMALQLDAPLPADVNPATPIILHKMLNAGSAFRHEFDYLDDLNKDAIFVKYKAAEKFISATGSCSSEDLNKTLSSMKEVLLNPRITDSTLKMAKKQIEDALELANKTPVEKLNKELFPNDNYGATDAEIREGLKKVTLSDVQGLYNYIMQNPSGTLVISAPFSKKPELLNTIFKQMGEFKNIQPVTPKILDNYVPVEKTKVLTDTHNKNQADIIEAFKFKNNGNLKDDISIMIMNTILGGNASSRLFNDLRETQKLAYSVKSTVNYNQNSGILKLRIGTTTENKNTGEISYDNLQKSIEGFNKQIEKIKTEKVTPKELENAKLYLKNSILSENEDTIGKTVSLNSDLHDYYGLNKENLLLEMIDSITADDVYNAANHVFNTKPVYSINATQNTLNANKEFLEQLAT